MVKPIICFFLNNRKLKVFFYLYRRREEENVYLFNKSTDCTVGFMLTLSTAPVHGLNMNFGRCSVCRYFKDVIFARTTVMLQSSKRLYIVAQLKHIKHSLIIALKFFSFSCKSLA